MAPARLLAYIATAVDAVSAVMMRSWVFASSKQHDRQSRRRRAVGWVAAGIIGAALAASGCGSSQSNSTSSSTSSQPILQVGVTADGYQAVVAGWNTGQPLQAAIKALGDPTSLTPADNEKSCNALWPEIKVTADFYNLGGKDACSPSGGYLRIAFIRGVQWETTEGLRIGDPEKRVKELYPKARKRVPRGPYSDSIDTRGWLLVPYYSPIGDGGWASPLVAVTDDGRVTSFRIDAYAGGE